MTSGFNVHDAAGYEQLMGRWSQKLAPLFIDFAGVAGGDKVLDVGCGTGSLTFALARVADLGEIAAIDYSPVFVEEAIRRNTDPRIKVRQADACALPFDGGTFDRALALLVLHFVPRSRQGSRRDGPRRSVGWRGRGSCVGPSRRHAQHAHDGRHGGGTKRRR